MDFPDHKSDIASLGAIFVILVIVDSFVSFVVSLF